MGIVQETSRERVLRALNHQEAEHVPFDLGGTGLSTIHVTLIRICAVTWVYPLSSLASHS